jgi:hypothetical protein
VLYPGRPNAREHSRRGPALSCHLSRCDNLVEQREHRSMTPAVVDVHECRGTVMRAEKFVAKLVSRVVVMGELVSRRNHCA